MKVVSIPCGFETFSNEEDDRKLNVKLKILHEGKNFNKTKFNSSTINEAESTLSDIPILGYIKYDEEGNAVDFDEHNMITKVVKDDNGYSIEYKFLERPLGVIPNNTEITYTEEDGKTYLNCTGLIWKHYSNSAYQLLTESKSKSVSMEIAVEDGEVDKADGYYNIKKFSFLGITILGDDIAPGIEGASINTYSNFSKYKKAIYDICKEMYSFKGKEENVLDKKKNDLLSIEEIDTSINSQLKNKMVEVEDPYWGGKYTAREYYLRTILPEEKIAILEDNINYCNYYGVPYSIDGDDVVLDYENRKSYIEEWREKKEGEVIETFSKEDTLKELVLEKFNEKEIEIKNLTEELESLRKFKADKEMEEYKVEVSSVVSEFNSLTEEEVKTFKESAIKKEISLEDLRKELSLLDYAKLKENTKKFNSDKGLIVEEAKINYSSTLEDENKNTKSYEQILRKHSNK
ncbi:hypothetical protein M1I50_09520 [Clostridioides difficile]|nr:hypothetical protein [Clostridioides difficile]MCL0943222.1 hypothetical protein [Clostridioides difficile]MCM4100996.1 hypothetical protein [Clostridioides difficile]MDI2845777.1 hypothetical protein [Clostridioides difficile]HBG5740266.1 hypothetical protein [Clostridioides difficile]